MHVSTQVLILVRTDGSYQMYVCCARLLDVVLQKPQAHTKEDIPRRFG